MADQEVIKHTKKVYKIWNSKEHSTWHKIKEFIIEILIIVFAVTLSIYLHSRSQHSHDQAEVKIFLIGLRNDLKADINEMQNDLASYRIQKKAFNYFSNLKKEEPVNQDSIKLHVNGIYGSTFLIPNNGRYEGFKTSGNIGKIENEKLRNLILDLYQEDLPSLLNSTLGYYVPKKSDLNKFIIQNRKRITDSTTNINEVYKMDEFYNYARYLSEVSEILERYTICINKMNEIIAIIEKEYELTA